MKKSAVGRRFCVLASILVVASGCGISGSEPNTWSWEADEDPDTGIIDTSNGSTQDIGFEVEVDGRKDSDAGQADSGPKFARVPDVSHGPSIHLPDSWSGSYSSTESCPSRPAAEGNCYEREVPHGVSFYNDNGWLAWPGEGVPCEVDNYRRVEGALKLQSQEIVLLDRCGRFRRYARDTNSFTRFGPPGEFGTERHDLDGRLDQAVFIHFGDSGQVESTQRGRPDRSKLETSVFHYSDQHRLKRLEVTSDPISPDGASFAPYEVEYEYNACGAITERLTMERYVGTSGVFETEYDSQNRKIRRVYRESPQGATIAVNEYEYRKENPRRKVRVIREWGKSKDDFSRARKITTFRHQDGRIKRRVVRSRYSPGASWREPAVSLYLYDEDRRLTEIVGYSPGNQGDRRIEPSHLTSYRYQCSWSRQPEGS